eukprot:TRINITY_DN33143_c0_g1_i1.p2 TRINITY_DN33143_c0_g1~~TRINITY_DN33143_c0_g1_i1.p2  ORF type:complete len:316 (-),score=137.58 TRINITY_DN33143_c0_g1_i1:28-975(-)
MFGRVRRMLDVIDPRSLFVSDERLQESIRLLDEHQERVRQGLGKAPGVTDEMLWEARSIKEAIVHPQTGEKIFFACRFSFFVPMNLPIVVGMLNAHTPAAQMFWQWYNQTYNVAVNHANRNASNEMSYSQIGTAYAGAVTTSCGIAWGLGEVIKRSTNFAPAVRALIRSLVPFVAVATAGAANAYLMRRNEAVEGIQVTDKAGNPLGVSPKAGQRALAQVALTRVVLPAPILIFPPLIMKWANARQFMKAASPRFRMGVEVAVVGACVWFALPVAIGLFPQISSVSVDELEEEFHNLTDAATGERITRVWYNKGL